VLLPAFQEIHSGRCTPLYEISCTLLLMSLSVSAYPSL
jgi:hypothetical protein